MWRDLDDHDAGFVNALSVLRVRSQLVEAILTHDLTTPARLGERP